MNKRVAALVLAGFVCVVGVVLLFAQVQATDAQAGSFRCGSAASPEVSEPDATTPAGEAEILDRLNSECAAKLGTQRTLAWVLLGVGVVGLVVSSVVFVSGRSAQPEPVA